MEIKEAILKKEFDKKYGFILRLGICSLEAFQTTKDFQTKNKLSLFRSKNIN